MGKIREQNMEKMKELFNRIQENITGLSTPVTKYICDENGEVSDEKIEEFTRRLIDYMCYYSCWYVGMDGARKHYYEILFYLIFKSYGTLEKVQTMGDFLAVVKELEETYQSREELIADESGYGYRAPRGFFKDLERSYEILAGHSPESELPEAEKQKAIRCCEKKQSEEERRICEIQEKYREECIEGYTDYWDAVEKEMFVEWAPNIAQDGQEIPVIESKEEILEKDPFFARFRVRASEKTMNAEEQKEKWIQSFENPGKYLEAYQEFCEMLCCVRGYGLLEEGIFKMLSADKACKLADDEQFRRFYVELDKVVRVARRL